MKIVADRVISDASTAFGGFGDVVLLDGRQIGPADLRDADLLLVRSVTRVDEHLLAGSRVRFVGTATAGTDHIDTRYLDSAGIGFAAAPGCNARAVGEYVLACVLAWAQATGRALERLRCGLVGVGHAGSAARSLLEAVGVRCLAHDPPRARREGGAGFVDLGEALGADVVSLHVPLTTEGDDATRHLLDAARVGRLRRGGLLINAARGGVVDEAALLSRLQLGDLHAVLDCWENEPTPTPAVVAAAWVATPHVAGHTVDARRRATRQLQAAVAGHLGLAVPAPAGPLDEVRPCAHLEGSGFAALCNAVTLCCDPRLDTPRLQSLAATGQAALAAGFDALRAEAGRRREFTAQPVALASLDPDTAALLHRINFPVGSP